MFVAVFLFGIGALQIVTSLNEYTYTKDVSTSGRVPSDVSPTSVRSRAECASLCSLESRCGGFYFSRPQQECFLELDTVFTNFTDNDAGLHYTKDAPVGIETSTVTSTVIKTTPTTAAAASTAPASAPTTTPNSTICLTSLTTENVSNYTFKISVEQVNQSEAMTQCANCGLQLLQLNNVGFAKFEALRPYLVETYSSVSFWTGAMRMINEQGNPWKNSGGDGVPSSVWSGNTPGSDEGEDCARLESDADHYMRDAECSSSYGAICEEQE